MTALVNRLGCSLSSKQRTINPPHRLAGKAPTYVVPIRCQARKSPQNGSSKSKNAKQREVKDGLDNGNHRKESRLIDIVRYRYFEEL